MWCAKVEPPVWPPVVRLVAPSWRVLRWPTICRGGPRRCKYGNTVRRRLTPLCAPFSRRAAALASEARYLSFEQQFGTLQPHEQLREARCCAPPAGGVVMTRGVRRVMPALVVCVFVTRPWRHMLKWGRLGKRSSGESAGIDALDRFLADERGACALTATSGRPWVMSRHIALVGCRAGDAVLAGMLDLQHLGVPCAETRLVGSSVAALSARPPQGLC